MELWEMSATQLARLMREKQTDATEVARSFCGRIRQVEPVLGAFLHHDEAETLRAATAAMSGPLAGLPVGLKDNICTRDAPTTCASRMLAGFVPPYEATVVRKLRLAEAIPAGKTNMDEFAMGASCETSYYKTTKNPWDTARVPGGSSGGSAAAVAAGMLPFALGSDTGGSVRQPAAFCGVVGLRPTYGAVSRFGLVAFASSLDQIGPMARTADDVALLFSAICGQDPADTTSRAHPCGVGGMVLADEPSVKELVIGIPADGVGSNAQVARMIGQLETAGAKVAPVALPSLRHALAAYYILSSAEASSNLARFDGIRYGFSAGEHSGGLADFYEQNRSQGFGGEVKRRIMLGTLVLSGGYYDSFYRRAKAMQSRIMAEFADAFRQCDMIATPTTPTTAFRLGEKLDQPVEMYACDQYTVPASMAGLPAVSFPCGLDENGLPIGIQLVGPAFCEKRLLEVVKCCEVMAGGFPRPEVPV